MSKITFDEHLIEWSEIEEHQWNAALLGNGFSANIWSKFRYPSLYDVAKSSDVASPLKEKSINLFKKLDSTNFEEVLRILYHARLVDEQLGSPQIQQIEELYVEIKSSLASAVNYSHVPYEKTETAKINEAFRGFKNIFTTNYDLIPYWAIMYDLWKFKDLFWSQGTCFDPKNTSVIGDSCVISFIHGAIHLVELPDGTTKKLAANNGNKLGNLFDLNHPEHFPLFISEGSSEKKLARIMKNDYLRFSFEKLRKMDGNIIVIGQSLHADYDQHLIDALAISNIKSIAISVWPHQAPEEIVHFKTRINRDLSMKDLYFFNSTTHPLGSSTLNNE